jgi:hypothetical protein
MQRLRCDDACNSTSLGRVRVPGTLISLDIMAVDLALPLEQGRVGVAAVDVSVFSSVQPTHDRS